MNVHAEIDRLAYGANIPIFAITGCNDFAHALPGWQHQDLMPRSKSMILFGRPIAGNYHSSRVPSMCSTTGTCSI